LDARAPRLDFGVSHEIIGRLAGLAPLLLGISTQHTGVRLGGDLNESPD
jgi:hypothetical protein